MKYIAAATVLCHALLVGLSTGGKSASLLSDSGLRVMQGAGSLKSLVVGLGDNAMMNMKVCVCVCVCLC